MVRFAYCAAAPKLMRRKSGDPEIDVFITQKPLKNMS